MKSLSRIWALEIYFRVGGWGWGCHNRRGRVRTDSLIRTTIPSHRPRCILTTNHDRPVLITVMTWPFQSMEVGILHLTTGIVAWQFPSSIITRRLIRCPRLKWSWCVNTVKTILTQWDIFQMNLRISLKVMLFIWPQWANKFHWIGTTDWQGWYGDTRKPLLHGHLLDSGHM